METFDCIKSRKSVRKYDKKDVPNEIIGQIIFAGTQAPSAGNIQTWEFIVVKDEKIKKELSIAALKQDHVFKAPIVIVVSADLEKSADKYGERGEKLYSIQDTAAAIENMLLTAHDLGLGACWVGAFEEEKVKGILSMPDRLRPVALISIGYPLSYDTVKKPKRCR
jgi:nitroreductase